MKNKPSKLLILILLPLTSLIVVACNPNGTSTSQTTSIMPLGIPVTQQSIQTIALMSDIPQPFQIIDYKVLAENFDQTVFNWNITGSSWPLIWLDNTQQNFNQATFGLYTAIGDVRQGPNVKSGMVHEAMAGMGAVLSGTLVGINKSNQNGYNYVGMLKNYFNSATGWDIMQNNTNPTAGAAGGGYARDWWYDVFPNLMFYAIVDRYPDQEDFIAIERSIADKFYAANTVLAGNYAYFYFNYLTMTPESFNGLYQWDAAAGQAWVMYAAYQKFGDQKYLTGSISALNALEALPYSPSETPSYEVLMPFGAYMAARLNAEQEQNFDIQKMMNWSFNGKGGPRPDWGVIVGNWNGFDVSGMVGSTTDRGGYGFLMNTYDMAWPIVPMVRYDQSYANMVGKWMLNAANVARMFYPDYMPANHQSLYESRAVTKGVIAYEGIINHSSYPESAPVAQGDGPGWAQGNPPETQFGIYGSAHVGIFGSIIAATTEPTILQLNLLATDTYHAAAYPSYLYYNPNTEAKTITLNLAKLHQNSILLNSTQTLSLYDTVSAKFVAEGLRANSIQPITIPAYTAVSLVIVPANGKVTINASKLLINNVIIDYHFQESK